MPEIVRVLKQEITRLSRKEVRAATAPLTRQLRSIQKGLRDRSRQLADLSRTVAGILRDQRRQPLPGTSEEGERAVRVSPASVRRHRGRLGLSQKEMASLLGVSLGTIVGWESGRSSPRAKNRQAIAEVRTMGIREARERLKKTRRSRKK